VKRKRRKKKGNENRRVRVSGGWDSRVRNEKSRETGKVLVTTLVTLQLLLVTVFTLGYQIQSSRQQTSFHGFSLQLSHNFFHQSISIIRFILIRFTLSYTYIVGTVSVVSCVLHLLTAVLVQSMIQSSSPPYRMAYILLT
jgi:hypothetical protein